MRDNKAFASLTSGLLARKGQARPAMRPQGGFGMNLGGHDDLGWNDMGHDVPRADTGRFGGMIATPASTAPVEQPAPIVAQVVAPVVATVTPVELTVETPAVVRQQEQLAEAMAAPVVVAEVAPRPVAPKKAKRAKAAGKAQAKPVRAPREAGRKAAFTLRLESERHLRLRLACAVQNRSAQQIVTAALDRFLGTLPDVERLATSLSAAGDGQD